MRIRTIKPEFWTSEDVWSLSDDAVRLFFIGLWNYVDDHGVGMADARLVKAALYPLSTAHSTIGVEMALDELEQRGMVCRYEAAGKRLLHIPTWAEHQKISHPSRPKFPPCVRCSGGLPEIAGGLRPQVACGGEGSSPSMEREQGREKEKGSGEVAGESVVRDPAEARRLLSGGAS